MSVLKEIVAGWSNFIFPSAEIEAEARKRAKVCSKCDHAVTGSIMRFVGDDIECIEGLVCDLCDCPLSAKTRSMDSKCEAGKWDSLS